jgi:hypothetical protein
MLDTATALVLGDAGRGSYTVSFVDRVSLTVKQSYSFPESKTLNRRLFDIEQECVIMSVADQESFLLSPHKKKSLPNFPTSALSMTKISGDSVLVISDTVSELVVYSLTTHTSYSAGYIEDLASAYSVKLSSHSISVFDFTSKQAWLISLVKRNALYTAVVFRLQSKPVYDFLRYPINVKDVKLVEGTFYFFSVSGVVSEIKKKYLGCQSHIVCCVWVMCEMRRTGAGFARLHPDLVRQVGGFLR